MATLRGVWAGLWAAFIGAALATAAWAEEEPAFVRERGDLDRLAIRGADTFGEAEIKQALAVDIDVTVAARPDGALETYRQVLADKTLAGYRLEGFADATVAANFDPAADQFVLEIHEGPRYLAGEVVVEGLEASLADRVREALTVEKPAANAVQPTPQPGAAKPKKKVVWSVGEPARLDLESQNRVREKVESALYDCGRLLPQFNVELVPDRVQHTVVLQLEFTEPGATAQIDEISVMGNKKFSRDEILEFLELRQGAPWTGEMPQHLEQRLKQSGRFTKAKVYDKQLARPEFKLGVCVNVTEYAKAPSLSQPLSRDEQALVQLSHWLAEFPNGEDDLGIEFKVEDYEIEAVVSPKLGVLVLVRKPLAPDAKQPAPLTWAFVTSDERIGFYSAPRGRKLVAIPTPTPVVANFQLSLHDGPPKFTGQGTFQFGLGMVSSGKRSRRRHCEFRFTDTPVSLLSLAHEYDSKLTWADDVLTVEYKGRSLKFNANTGRLIEVADDDKENCLRMSVAPGKFELKLAELDAATRDLPNEAAENAERPLSSVLEFLADEALAWKDQEQLAALQPQLRVLRKLVSLGLLKPLDRLGVAACKPPFESNGFGIPCKPFNFNFSGFQFNADWFHDAKVQVTLGDLAEVCGLRLQEYVVPSGGWAQGVYRAVIYAQAKKGAPPDRAVDLTKLCASPASGPLCCLSAAAAATEWPLGVPASLFANLGKTKLTLAAFQNDYRPLLDGKSFVGECLLCLADVLRGLEAEEVETLLVMLKTTECLDQPSLDALSAIAAVLRQHREGPVDQALAASLDQLWQLGLREQIAKLLEQLADEPKSPSTPAAPEAPGVAVYGVYQAAPYEASTKPYGGPATADAAKEPNFLPLAMEGFCPVTLVKERTWQQGDPSFPTAYEGQRYHFASAEKQEAFLKSPDRFVPRLRGYDVVQFVDHDRVTLGSRDYGVFYLDGIWLFESEASRSKFEDNPKRYTTGSLNDAQAADSAAAQSPMPPAAASERSDCEAFPRVSRGGFFETSEAARNVPSNGYAAYGSSNGSAGSSADAYPKTSWNELVKLPAPEPNSAPPIQPAAGQPPLALEGYSAVTLVELRKWRLGDPRYSAIHRGRLYLFASEFEQQAFVKDPDRYRVGNDGFDIVEQVDHQRQTLGKCQYGAFWCQQILLFSSQESRAHFERNSGPYHRAMFSSVFSEGLLSDGRYENHRPAAEAERSTAAAPAKTTPRAAPTRVGRRRAFGRRIR